MSNYEVFADSETEANWFASLTPLLGDVSFHPILRRGRNPRPVESLIKYDRPDIILLYRGEPVLVLEKTSEVPTGHNVGQRLARIVRAVEVGVPAILYAPFRAMKHGRHANECQLNIRLLSAFRQMAHHHGVPAIAIEWPSDKFGELLQGEAADAEIRAVIEEYLDSNHELMSGAIQSSICRMSSEYARRISERPQYAALPPSVTIEATQQTIDRLAAQDTKLANALSERPETLVYNIGMRPEKCKRQDPYTGMQFLYDYTDCRSGPDVADKHRNLVLHFPLIQKRHWLQNNPNDPRTKSSNWYLTANALIFSDGSTVIR
jgi:hypothetical protein